jgi:poly-gamma-glutamate capsule biosynthesis protein CapA/YwtB (metallophosphatase superfamily)
VFPHSEQVGSGVKDIVPCVLFLNIFLAIRFAMCITLIRITDARRAMRYFFLIFLFCATVLSAVHRPIPIEDFNDGLVELTSFPEEDMDSTDWAVDTLFTAGGSTASLHLWGNTWKTQSVSPVTITSGSVFQISAFVEYTSELQGIALGDDENLVFYSFAGTEEADPDVWVTTYQGAFPSGAWQIYDLPVGHDFLARFEYLPTITRVVYINDKDSGNPGSVWFDNLCDITADLPVAPSVSIQYDRGQMTRHRDGSRLVSLQFHAVVTDPDSDSLNYRWDFGDGATSTESDPAHDFVVTDDHPYTVRLEVIDDTARHGYAAETVEVDPGTSTLPFTINFVGDIMLGRYYLTNGGVIATQGVDAVFDPTRDLLQDADITVANLECCFTDATTHHPTKSIWFKGRQQDLDGIVNAGIDIVTQANNHSGDYLLEGLLDTQEALDERGILHSGAGIDEYQANLPLFYTQSGINLAFLASCDRTGQYNNAQPFLNAAPDKYGFAMLTPYNLQQQYDAVDGVADLKIVEMHAGSEYSTTPGHDYDRNTPDYEDNEDEDYSPLIDVPRMWDIELRHYAVDNGADLVIAHHPHILHGFEMYNGVLIAHSLGNFAFDLSYPETMSTCILKATCDGSHFTQFDVTPVFIDNTIPRRATGDMGRHILNYLARRSQELGTILVVDPGTVTAQVLTDPDYLTVADHSFPGGMEPDTMEPGWQSEPIALEQGGNLSALDATANTVQYSLGRDLIWFGNMEDEGCTLWNLNSSYEQYDSEIFANGERSIRVGNYTGNDGVTVNLENRFKCYSDSSRYSLRAMIRTENATEASIGVRYYTTRDQNTYLGEEWLPAVTGTNDWTFYTMELSVPAGTNYFDIRLNGDFDETGTYAWFDDVSLIEWTNWSPVTGRVQVPCPNDFYFLQWRFDDTPVPFSYTCTHAELGIDTTPVIADDATAPAKAIFNRLAPNPFNPETRLDFSLAEPARIRAEVFNLRGQRVRVLSDENHAIGSHSLTWDGRDDHGRNTASGVYLFRLQANGKTVAVRKGVLLK